jgi:hypothetical protein
LVREATERSSLLKPFPEIELETQAVGIFGRLTQLDAGLKDGDRVGIYRPIRADPETVERREDWSGSGPGGRSAECKEKAQVTESLGLLECGSGGRI